MTDIFKTITIGNLELKNRVMRSATWDGTADGTGKVTNDSVRLYMELGQGNIGLIISGHSYVSPLGQATPAQYGIHTDDMIPGLKRMVEAAHQGGAKIAIQLAHCGFNSGYLRRQGIPVQVVSYRKGVETEQQEMTGEDINLLIDSYASAAQRAVKAGFDAIQLHGAHGYLMSQFLSPLSNTRTDKWGGNAENRRRFHLEVIKRIRQAIDKDFPLMIKFGVMKDSEDRLALDESLETARQMVEQGIDAIEVSAGDNRGHIPRLTDDLSEQVAFRDRAIAAKKAVQVPVMLVGGIRSLETANEILQSGDADMISMCRPFIREPHLMVRWQRGKTEPATCISCNKCIPSNRIITCGENLRLREEANSS
ncbi:NADH:flavin oxidoreductase [Chloroflexota bacterium]